MNDMMTTGRRGAGELASLDPFETRAKLAGLEGDIVRWRLLKDWPSVEAAVDEKIAEQAAFVANWDATVRPRGDQINVPEGGHWSAKQAVDTWGFTKQTVSRWRSELKDTQAYRAKLILGAHRLAALVAEENHRAMGTGENEWFTPGQYIQAARAVMGGIDLDPASHDIAQETVQADTYYTREDNALDRDWMGRVWLNPPYAREEIEPFVAKLIDEIEAGRVSEAIMLTHNYTDSGWFQKAAIVAEMICFPRVRVKFTDIDGKASSPTQGQAFFYYGDNTRSFHEVFSEYGLILHTA